MYKTNQGYNKIPSIKQYEGPKHRLVVAPECGEPPKSTREHIIMEMELGK